MWKNWFGLSMTGSDWTSGFYLFRKLERLRHVLVGPGGICISVFVFVCLYLCLCLYLYLCVCILYVLLHAGAPAPAPWFGRRFAQLLGKARGGKTERPRSSESSLCL